DLVAVAAAVGVGQSDDAGETWTWSHEGLHASYCRAVALAEGWLLASASTGPATQQAAVYRRPLDDPQRPFAACGGGSDLPAMFPHNIDTFCLVAAGNLVAVGERHGRVYLSDDAGQSWRTLADALPGVHCLAFAS
ncbi:MAG: WD40/YVTN/BNR-like repeat-containing protein, partial [Acidimicrobiales bacterium]